MLPFEILPLEPIAQAPTPHRGAATDRPLPLYVAPMPEESLFSWLQRLATRLGVSFHALASQSFGIDDRAGRTVWWHRPHRWSLSRISQRTGVSVPQLRRMTFEGLQPVYREDEDPARFAGRRYDTRAPDWRAYRHVVCGACLESDRTPYVRSLWHLGWLAICPRHHTILLSRCEQCHSGLRVAQFATAASFSPTTCSQCGEPLLTHIYPMSHPAVIRMQEAMLAGKQDGVVQIEGLDTFTWHEFIAMADFILGMIWTHTTSDERLQILLRYEYESVDEPRIETQIYGSRHDSLRFLAWLIEGWPESPGATLGRDMLRRGLDNQRNRLSHHILPRWKGHPWSPGPHDLAPEICARLRKLTEV